MAHIKRINTSQIVGRSPFNEDDDAIMPAGTLVIYQDGDQPVLRMHDGVTNGGNPVGGISNQLENDGATLTLTDQGALVFDNGGLITETEVTGNPTMVIAPSNPAVDSQVLLIKGGGLYQAENNGIALNWNIINPQVGDTVDMYVYAPAFANQTLYWWIHPAEANISDPGTGTISIDEFGYGVDNSTVNFTVDSDDYEFTVRVSPTENVYDPEGTGVESLTFNTDQPALFDHHLHLTTGDLTETSIILGTDDHNVRTTTDGGVEITTPNEGNNVWQFRSNGDLELPSNGGIVFDRANTTIRVGQGFHIASGEGVTIDAVDETNPENLVYKSWYFNLDGNLALPEGGDIVDNNGDSVLSGDSVSSRYRLVNGDAEVLLSSNFDLTIPGVIKSNSGSSYIDPADNYVVLQTAQDVRWTFASDGNLTLPAGGDILDSNGDSVLGGGGGPVTGISITDDNLVLELNDPLDSNIVIRSIVLDGNSFEAASTELSRNNGFVINTNVNVSRQQWQFSNAGELVFPNATIQTTAWTGSVDWNDVTNTPTINTGAITFDDNTVQANPLDTVGTKITVNTNYLGQTSQNSNVFALSKTADTDQVQIGWSIKGTDGVGQTVTNKADSGGYWSFFVAGGRQTSYPITIESADYRAGAAPQLTLSVAPDDVTATSWTFDADGSITFPDETVQTTAWTGVASAGTTSTTSANVGYIGMPQNLKATSYTLVAGDQGKHIYVTAASQTITVPANATTAFPVGTTIAIIAGPTANPVTIAIASDTMYLGGVGSTGNRTLAAYGMATLVKVAETVWFINGSGLS